MMRILPQSLLGQVMLVLAFGLFVGQTVSAFLLYQAIEQRREAAAVSALAFRLVAEGSGERAEGREARRAARRAQRRRDGDAGLSSPNRPLERQFRLGIERTEQSPVGTDEDRLTEIEHSLSEVLAEQDVDAASIIVTRREAGDDQFVRNLVEDRPRLRRSNWEGRTVLVAGIERPNQQGWIVARVTEPQPQMGGLRTIVLQTLLIFAILFALLFLVLRRITRPLAQLTTRVTDFSRAPDQVIPVEESGPADMRRLISAHNAMQGRIAALLDEKDVMLGAIGHDLKTPLAALRVRIESVPDETQRSRMAQSIEDITTTLDDILALARVSRSGNGLENTDLSILAASVVEEFEDLGEAVSMNDGARVVGPVQVTWIKRALRNLIGNAVRYGQSAYVDVIEQADVVVLRVEDEGPGIPEAQIEAMLEPFTRGESSRNRATGGAGLGLALARAVAEQHGGTLTLSNRTEFGEEKGLRAEIRLPRS
ncbi:MAG: ATP-binding protein [Erythrobacter sp.]